MGSVPRRKICARRGDEGYLNAWNTYIFNFSIIQTRSLIFDVNNIHRTIDEEIYSRFEMRIHVESPLIIKFIENLFTKRTNLTMTDE